MDLFNLFSLIAAAFSGATMGSFLLVTLLYSALLKQTRNLNNNLFIYRRLYRLNTALSLLGGVCAALTNNRSAAFMLAIIAASYVFNHAHILKGLTKTCNENYQVVNFNNYRALSSLQNLMHLGQFTAAGYVIYLLAIQNLAITS
ncbi:hypothetical protein MNBD_GAMMA09-1608 [hydrothermal vent metagenome]|uniref:DUF4149 domain-containing protein n=1 Tax=hydrothermal vent metagenome TaxID=652676 RepID=A0A3B0XZX2_9ZZZZ